MNEAVTPFPRLIGEGVHSRRGRGGSGGGKREWAVAPAWVGW